jgi:hypothetical protein
LQLWVRLCWPHPRGDNEAAMAVEAAVSTVEADSTEVVEAFTAAVVSTAAALGFALEAVSRDALA